MKFQYWLFITAAFFLSSCKWGEPQKQAHTVAKDTLNYSYQNLKMTSDDCSNKPDSSCAIFKISYPHFRGQNKLDDSITVMLRSILGSSKKGDTSLANIGRNFINSYKEDKKGGKSYTSYELEAYGKVIRQDSSILMLETGSYSETGGAHPSESKYFINWNTKNNKKICLDDIFIPDYKTRLTSIAETVFRKEEKLDPGATLKNDYFFKNGQFALNNNFAITPAGIRFYYNDYEIKPYAAGPTDLFLPYALIKPLLRPNTVIKQYIK